VLRRHEQAGPLSGEEADAALRATRILIDHRYPHVRALAEQAWTLRSSLSFYNAIYVALAGRLDNPLITGDVRLTRAPGLPCRVELV
jgi:predicted nucleic acid-binding protein